MVGRGNTKNHCKSPWILSIEFDVFTRYFYLETLKQFSMVYIVMFSVIANPYLKISRISNRTWESRPRDSCLKQICLKSGPHHSPFNYMPFWAIPCTQCWQIEPPGWPCIYLVDQPSSSTNLNDSTISGQKNRALFLRHLRLGRKGTVLAPKDEDLTSLGPNSDPWERPSAVTHCATGLLLKLLDSTT